METIQVVNLTPATAAMQLKYDYTQLDSATAITTRGAAIEIKTNAERAKVSMIAIGQKLAEVKALLPHGQFEDWCQVEFDMSQRTAQRMMAAAEVFGGKNDTVSLLSDSAMYMLSGPNVPEAARVEVVEMAKDTGATPTKAEVQAVIDKHKPDEELRDKCHKIEFWLMGKGWSGFGRKNEEGKFVSGVRKGEHCFSWVDDDWADNYEKVKAAEKIERAALAAFIKLTPAKSDTVSPLEPQAPSNPSTFAPIATLEAEINNWLIALGAQGEKRMPSDVLEGAIGDFSGAENKSLRDYLNMKHLNWKIGDLETALSNVRKRITPSPTGIKRPLTTDESIAIIYRVMKQRMPHTSDPNERLTWLNKNSQIPHYQHALSEGVKFDLSVFCSAWASVAGEQRKAIEAKQRAEEKAAKQESQPPDRSLPSSPATQPDPLMDEDEDNEPYTSAMVNLAERENKSSSLMATPTAVDLQLPSISIPDKDLFMSQVKRSVGVLSEEGYATVANFLRIVGRYAFDAQPAPLDAPEAPRADDGGQSREERIIGMTSILETALMLVVEDYGQLTGKWTHVAPAERALKQLIEVLKENLTK